MRVKGAFSRFAALLLLLPMLLAAVPVGALDAPAPLTVPNVTLSPGGFLWTVARQPDGGIVFGGYFTSVNGLPRGHIARLLPNGSLDPDWNPSANGLVKTVAVDSSGAVFAGGTFDVIGGRGRNTVGKLAGSGSGAADATWNAAVLNPSGGGVDALALDANGALYLGGSFTSVGGLTRTFLAKVSSSGSGAVDTNWNPGPFNTVKTLVLDGAGALYVGGNFASIGGQSRSYIAKLSASGTGAADASWNPAANGIVSTLAVDSSGAVYAGGSFTSIGGQSRSRIAKLAGTGTGAANASWNPSANGNVLALLVDGVSVYAGGSFSSIGGQTRNRLAKLAGSGSGAADAAWNPSADDDVHALAPGGAGSVHVVGVFNRIGGESRDNFAALPGEVIWRTLTYSAAANGTIGGISPQTVADGGRGTAVTAVPNTGYTFVQWSDGSTANPRTDTNVRANLSVSASFAAALYTVRAYAYMFGSIAPAQRTVAYGDTTTFTLNPAAGAVSNVTGCGGSVSGNTYTTAPISADCIVEARFPLATYTVTATAGANGTITPASQTVDHGATTTFTVTPVGGGYQASAGGCGGSLSGSTYTTGAVTADCAVTASFVANLPNLSLTIDAGRDHARYGQVLSYAVTLNNSGSAAANPTSIAMVLPPQLDASAASWTCTNAAAGAQCTASGSGALQDNGVVLPPGRSLTWLVSVPVRANAPGGDIVTTVSATAGAVSANGSNRVTLVLLRDGFEGNGEAAHGFGVAGEPIACSPVVEATITDEAWARGFTLPPAGAALFDTILVAHGQDGGGFRVERANLGAATWLQLIAIARDDESASAWTYARPGVPLTLAIDAAVDGLRTIRIAGAAMPLASLLPAPLSIPLRIQHAPAQEAGCH